MKTSDLLVRCLENEGVEYIFGIPGEENLDFVESLRGSSIKLVLTRHEQAAGFMAATVGRLTGRVGVCLSTLGPGATNFVTSAAYALLGGMPALFLTGQKPIRASKQGRFQIIDIVQIMQPVTKFTRQIVDGNNVPNLVRECFRVARAEKPGPVHLELPEDIASEPVEREPFHVTDVLPPGASERAIQKAAEMIQAAKRPLLLIASASNRNNTAPALRDFVDRTGLYFLSTQMGKGAIDERHPRCLGTAALSARDYVHCAIDRADLILNVGHDVSEKPPFIMQADGKCVIHVSYFPAVMDDVYFPQHEVIGCTTSNMRMLADAITPSDDWDLDYFGRMRTEIDTHVFKEKADVSSFPNIPQRIVADLRHAMPSDGILSLDNGMYKIWFARNYQAHEPNTVLLDNALASMGAGLPAAIAAKIVHPDRKVVAICGDGGFMMNSQEMETAVRLKLDLVVIVLRDNGYGMIKWKQAGAGFPVFGLDFGNPDFVEYAESYGAHGTRIERTGQLVEELAAAFEAGGVHLIEVPVDYSENEAVFLEALAQKTCIL
ncbi:MAG: acetolactate synthase large subunit [Deltaproteobacteria bacterium]|nr:acetolactate synthase large subunit [Deltaproteobacteria bacterium]